MQRHFDRLNDRQRMVPKRYFFSLVFFLSVTLLSAENPVQELFFELTRQTVCGASALSRDALPSATLSSLATLSAFPARFFMRPVWQAGMPPQQLIELFYPEKRGVLAATFSYDDVYGGTERGTLEPYADWVDAVLLSLRLESQEPEPLSVAELLLSDMDNRDDAGIVEGTEQDTATEATFTDSEGKLRRFTYGVEHFSVQEQAGKKIITDSADGIIVRRTFDTDLHLILQERFSFGSASQSLKLLSLRSYLYHPGEKLPYQMTEDITEGNIQQITQYDAEGYPLSRSHAHYVSSVQTDKKTPTDASSLVSDKKTVWAYDAEKRVIAEETITYLYTKTATGKEKREEQVIKKYYDYDGRGKAPDVSYFENEKLRMHTVYESENVYNETMYFDGGFTVQTQYINGIKTTEIVLLDGKELRRRNFE